MRSIRYCLILLIAATAHAQGNVFVLEQGKPVAREIKSGESHSYRVGLISGQFLHAIFNHESLDMAVNVYSPDGSQVFGANTLNLPQSPRHVYLTADSSGDYRIEVRLQEKEASSGKYEALINELRAAAPLDRTHIAALKAFAEGERLRNLGTKESLLQSLEKYEAVLPHWRAKGDQESEAATLSSVGAAFFALGENQKGIECLNQALRLWRSVGNQHLEIISLNSIANVFSSLGESQKALDYYSQALPLTATSKNKRWEAVTLNGIGKVYADAGEHQRALGYYNQALTLRRTAGDKRGEAVTLHNIGNVYDNTLQDDHALESYSKALELFRLVGDQRGEASALNNSARIFVDKGQFPMALDYFGQSLKIKQAAGDRKGEASTLNNIGYIYILMSDKKDTNTSHYLASSSYSPAKHLKQALEHLNKAQVLWRSLGEPQEESAVLAAISKIYASLGDYQQSAEYSSKAAVLRQSRTANANNRRAESASNLGDGEVQNTVGGIPTVAAPAFKSPLAQTPPQPSPFQSSAPQKQINQPPSAQPDPVQTIPEKNASKESPSEPPKSESSVKESAAARAEKTGRARFAQQKPQPDASAAKPEKAVEPSEPSQNSLNAPRNRFVIQVGASANKAIAEELAGKLREAGLECYVVQANVAGKGVFHRVRIGGYNNVEEARKSALELRARGVIEEYFITTKD